MSDGRRRELEEPANPASSSLADGTSAGIPRGGVLLRIAPRRYSPEASTQPGESSSGPASLRWDASKLPLVEPGSYAVDGELAHGGIGRILKGRDQRLGRTVALKELIEGGGAAEERFVREALVTARLQHPSIVPVYEAGRWPTGEPFYAMKLVSGRSLDEVIATAKTLDQRLALLPHVLAVAEAVAYAHSERIIHRDLKPSNVLVGAFGETVVIDWGLAKDLDEAAASMSGTALLRRAAADLAASAAADAPTLEIPRDPASQGGTLMSRDGPIETRAGMETSEPGLTMAGAVLGTPSYMPPEQAEGQSVDERADVYALGAILYHVLAGAAPYTGKTSLEILKKTRAGPPPAIEKIQRGVPQDLVTIVNKAMARAIDDRYPTAKELADDLRRFQTGQIVGAHKYSRFQRLIRFGRRNRGAVGVAGAALVVLAVVAIVSVRGIVDARNRAEQERDRAAQKQVEAEAARGEAMLRADELTLAQARDLAPRDPNKAIELLRTLSPAFSRWGVARTIAADARAHGIARVFQHGASANVAAMSPDGTSIATGCDDKVIRLIDLNTGHTHELKGHTDEVYWLQYSEDGKRLASHGKDSTLREWDLDTGAGRVVATDLGTPFATADLGHIVAFSQRVFVLIDARTGARTELGRREGFFDPYALSTSPPHVKVAFSTRGELSVYDVKSRQTKRLPAKKDVQSLALTPGGDTLAAGDLSGAIHLFDTATGAERELLGHTGEIARLAFSPDGKTLVSASNDRTTRFWDLSSGTSHEVEGHTGEVRDLRFSKDGRTVVSAGTDRAVRVWDASGRNGRVLLGFEDTIFKVAVSKNGRVIVGASADHTVRVWDLAGVGERLVAAHTAPVHALAIPKDGKLIASASLDGEVRLTDVASVLTDSAAVAPPEAGRLQLRLPGRKMARRGGRLIFSPDGRRLAQTGEDGALEVWNIPGGGEPMVLLGHTDTVEAIVFSRDGNTLYSASRDKTVRRWDLNQGVGSILYEHAGAVTELALSPDGTRLASGGEDRMPRVWHLGEGRARSLSGHSAQVSSVAFSPDGRSLLTGSQDHTLRVWNLEGGASDTHYIATPVHAISFSPDGRSFFLQGRVNTLQRWDAAEQKPLPVYRGHAAPIRSFALSSDGLRVVTGSLDRTARIADLATGEGRALAGHWDEVLRVAYMPDGRSVVSSGKDGLVRLWLDDLPDGPDELRAWLKAAIPEVVNLSPKVGEHSN
jgi:WD40 repeat protein/serine/threonine protein kinase